MEPKRIWSVRHARALAARRVPRVLFDYVDGGADDEVTMTENERAFREVVLAPRMGTGVTEPELATEVLGERLSLPVLLAPCGLVSALHPDGPAGAARAATAAGTVSVLSAVAGVPPEAVAAAAPGPKWFQVYAPGGPGERDELVARAGEAGYSALVLTLDTPALGNRERDAANGITSPMRLAPGPALRLAAQVLARPTWAVQMGAAALAARRDPQPSGPTVGLVAAGGSPFTWDDVAQVRGRFDGPVLVKGILGGADARRALEAGAHGVIVSNHGGRQLDGVPATLRVLPEVAEVVGGDGVVLLDGGVRRGGDVAKALALGADAVLVGRPFLYGLAAAGEAGVGRVLELLRRDLARTLTLMGCPSVAARLRRWAGGPPGRSAARRPRPPTPAAPAASRGR